MRYSNTNLSMHCRFSPVLNLDNYVADWAYNELKEQHEAETSCFSCSKFPKRSEVNITVNWSKVNFKHSESSSLYSLSLRLPIILPPIGYVDRIPTMQFFPGISSNTQSKSCMLSLAECVWEFLINALWDTQKHDIFTS